MRLYEFANLNENISGEQMLHIFQTQHHEAGMNPAMDEWVKSHDWVLKNIKPSDIPGYEELFDYDDPFDRVIDIDEDQVRRYVYQLKNGQRLEPVILGPRFADGKFSIVDGNHRALAYHELDQPIPAYIPVKAVGETGMIFARKKSKGGVKTTQKFTCTSGPRAGKRVSSIAQCFAPIDVSKKIQMTKTRARTAERQARRAKRTKRIDPSSLLTSILNKARRPSKKD